MTKHIYAVWALRELIYSFHRNSPRYDHMAGYVEGRIAQIEAAISVLEADQEGPPVSLHGEGYDPNAKWKNDAKRDGIPLKDLPKWKAGQAAKKQ